MATGKFENAYNYDEEGKPLKQKTASLAQNDKKSDEKPAVKTEIEKQMEKIKNLD